MDVVQAEPIMEAPPFALTPLENALFSLLLAASPAGCNPRVAGGWVRDKLLNKGSHDIDIALDTMTGEEFAAVVLQHIQDTDTDTNKDPTLPKPPTTTSTSSPGPTKRPKIAVIQSNPSQSKHLSTATLRIFTLSIDFVELRSETYADSRIPTVDKGTAFEDAMRRDFTLNALFYNLRNNTVEDFTRQGLADLRANTLRTPLPPLSTFNDDPLRCLRAVRFASRFGLTVEPDIIAALKDEAIHSALMSKVSRERVGIEIDTILTHPTTDVARAFQLLYETNLAGIVFASPPPPLYRVAFTADFPNPVPSDVETLSAAPPPLTATHVESIPPFLALANLSSDHVRILYLTVPLLPFARLQFDEIAGKGKVVKRRSVAHFIVRDQLKLKGKDASAADQILTFGMRKGLALMQAEFGGGRRECGLFVRECKDLWKVALAVAAVESGGYAAYERVVSRIAALELGECYLMRPLLDGKMLQKELNIKNGPAVGEWMQKGIVWQLENPQGSKEQCLEALKLQLE